MEKNKKLLLISSLLILIYIVPSLILNFNSIIGDNIFLSIYNVSMYSLSIIGSIIFLYYSLSKKDINRGLELIISIIFFLINIISGILGFIYFRKTSKYKKRELPQLEILYNHKKIIYILAFVLSMIIMFIIPLFIDNKVVNIVSEIFIFLLMILLFYKDLKRDFKYFKEYFREYNSYVWKMFGISFAVMFILAISIRFYTGLITATNQLDLIELFDKIPIYLILIACIYAPITEELLFRGTFRKIINNKYLFIIICGVLFGVLHVIDDFQSIKELLFILVYSSLGIFLSSVYYKTNNLFANIYFHFIQNSLAVIAIILVKFIGI